MIPGGRRPSALRLPLARPLLEVLAEHVAAVNAARQVRCAEHPAYEADYCPACGTARIIGSGR